MRRLFVPPTVLVGIWTNGQLTRRTLLPGDTEEKAGLLTRTEHVDWKLDISSCSDGTQRRPQRHHPEPQPHLHRHLRPIDGLCRIPCSAQGKDQLHPDQAYRPRLRPRVYRHDCVVRHSSLRKFPSLFVDFFRTYTTFWGKKDSC